MDTYQQRFPNFYPLSIRKRMKMKDNQNNLSEKRRQKYFSKAIIDETAAEVSKETLQLKAVTNSQVRQKLITKLRQQDPHPYHEIDPSMRTIW